MKNLLKKHKNPQDARSLRDSSQMRQNSNVSPHSQRRRRSNDSNKNPKKRSQTKFRKNIIKYAFIGLVVIVLGLLSWNNSRILKVKISDSQDKYLRVVEQYLDRHPFANLKPLVSTEVIANNLSDAYPEVASATIKVPIFGDKIEVTVTTRKDQLVLKTGEKDYFVVDQEGYAYARYDIEKGLEGVLILEDDTEVEYGSDASGQFVASTLVSFIQLVNRNLSEIEAYKNQAFSFRITNEPRIVYVKPSKVGYEIKLQQDISVEQQIDNLSSALKYLNNKKITPQKYIDVRVNGTVYYK